MIVQVDEQDHLTAVGLWANDGVILFVGGSRAPHVLVARGSFW
jgi:hypothetical protein